MAWRVLTHRASNGEQESALKVPKLWLTGKGMYAGPKAKMCPQDSAQKFILGNIPFRVLIPAWDYSSCTFMSHSWPFLSQRVCK